MSKIISDIEVQRPPDSISSIDFLKWFTSARAEIISGMVVLLEKPECAEGREYYKCIGEEMINDFESRNCVPTQLL